MSKVTIPSKVNIVEHIERSPFSIPARVNGKTSTEHIALIRLLESLPEKIVIGMIPYTDGNRTFKVPYNNGQFSVGKGKSKLNFNFDDWEELPEEGVTR